MYPVWLVVGMVNNPLDVKHLLQLHRVSDNLHSAVKLTTDDLQVTRLSQGEYWVPGAVGTCFSWLECNMF